ncbi:LysR family transcriptional regulator [Georgenia sp.]
MVAHRPSLDLDALRVLTLVADLGSISAAARAEQISQPSASKRIQGLERQLGLELLDRRTRGATLTDHGRLVTGWCRAVVDATDSLVTGSQALSARAAERLSIGASQTIAEYLAPSWLGEFRRRGGEPSVQLRVANSQGVIAALRSREIELGFVETPTIPTDLLSRQVATDRLVLVVSPDHRLARRHEPVSRDELAVMSLATREDGSGTRDTLQVAVGQAMAAPAVELDSNAAVKVLVSSGSYPAVISELAVAGELRDGRLVEVPLRDVDLSRSLDAVWRRGTRLRAAASHFLLTARPKAGPTPTREPTEPRQAARGPAPAPTDGL